MLNTGSVVVTGASSGFGRQAAILLAQRGYPVVAVARREDRLRDLESAVDGLPIHSVVADVRDYDELKLALSNVPKEFSDVGILINNAGLSKGFGPVQCGDIGLWKEMIDTNIVGLLNVTNIVLPRLVERGAGHVVNVGSIAATYPYMGGNVYGASKAFVHQFSLNMRVDLDRTGVRVSCISPGMARTEFATVRYDGDNSKADALYADVTPLRPEDVAEAIAWCLSQPPHVNINHIEMMPVDQPFGLGLSRPPRAAAESIEK